MSELTFKCYSIETAPEGSRALMKDIEGAFGFMPEIFGYMAESPEMLEAYTTVKDLMSKTSLTPAQQQLVLLAISQKTLSNYTNHLTHPAHNPALLKMIAS